MRKYCKIPAKFFIQIQIGFWNKNQVPPAWHYYYYHYGYLRNKKGNNFFPQKEYIHLQFTSIWDKKILLTSVRFRSTRRHHHSSQTNTDFYLMSLQLLIINLEMQNINCFFGTDVPDYPSKCQLKFSCRGFCSLNSPCTEQFCSPSHFSEEVHDEISPLYVIGHVQIMKQILCWLLSLSLWVVSMIKMHRIPFSDD